MQYNAISKVLGIFLMIFSLSMLPPLAVGALFHDTGINAPFLSTFALTLLTGLVLWLPFRTHRYDIKNRDGFMIVILFWSVLSVFGALPFILSTYPHVSFTDAVFESVSGLTTTGTNVFTGLDHLPQAIRYYRQQIEFLGGMGIIVLAVAILPMLGIGGMQLYRAETPGPIKDSKLTPRITETAKALWYIYLGLMLACALSYWLCGMTLFDALCESFGTVSTGGFSIHDASFGYYHNKGIYLIASFFMLLGATNFGLHYIFLRQPRFQSYWQDVELRTFVYVLVITTLITAITLLSYDIYHQTSDAVVQSIFTVFSLASTTGFVADNFAQWPTFVPYLIMFVAIIGGCAGSTSGGIKMVRAILLHKQGMRELKKLLHPKATLTIKLNQHIMPEHIINAIWGFVAIFLAFFTASLLLLLATGLDFTTAFGAVAACLSNAGAGIGKVALDFGTVDTFSKWILIVDMLAGRLEVFTLMVLFIPSFWRR